MEYYAQGPDGGGKWITQTLPLDRGKFSMQGVSLGPTLANISMPGSRGIFIWIEPGNEIKISGEASDPATWTVEGNNINREWDAFRRENAKQPDSLQKDIVRYIEVNPESRLSALLLLTEFDRRERPEEFVKLWNSLDKKARAEETARIIGDADIISEFPFTLTPSGQLRYDAPKRKINSLALRLRGDKNEMLRFNPGKPTLLWFYRKGDKERYENADTLRSLLKEYPDSTGRIAAVSLDADSITWRASMENDSLPKAINAWMPFATAGNRERLLGVTSTPYIIVVSAEGDQIYRGQDIAKASAAYRKLLPAKARKSAEKDSKTQNRL